MYMDRSPYFWDVPFVMLFCSPLTLTTPTVALVAPTKFTLYVLPATVMSFVSAPVMTVLSEPHASTSFAVPVKVESLCIVNSLQNSFIFWPIAVDLGRDLSKLTVVLYR